jgi:hypothetical protein
MKKAIAIVLGLSMILSIALASARNVMAEQMTGVLLDFDTDYTFYYSGGANLTLSNETVSPLQGTRSLKVEVGALGSGVDNFITNALAAPTGFEGIVMRYSNTNPNPGVLRFTGLQGSSSTTFGTDAKLINLAGTEVASSFIDWAGLVVPGMFDGYIFLPFVPMTTDSLPNAPVDTNSTINLDVMFVGYTEGGWNNTTSLFDLISYYKGTDYAGIIEELDQHGAQVEESPIDVELDFDTDYTFFYSGGTNLTLSNETVSPLQGTRSLKVEVGALGSGVDNFITNELAAPTGFEGIVMRYSNTNPNPGVLRFTGYQGSNGTTFGTDAKLINLTGTEAASSFIDWAGLVVPGMFDGYIFLPFVPMTTDSLPNAPVDTNSTINLGVMFVGYTEGGWNNTTSLFDLISYYKGTDYAGIIEELDQHGAQVEESPIDVELDFDTDYTFYYSGGANLTLSNETVSPLQGARSLKVEVGALGSGVDNFITNELAAPTGFEGIVMRYSNTNPNPGVLRFTGLQGSSSTTFGTDAKLINLAGTEVASSFIDWAGLVVPGMFDGYIFLPFVPMTTDSLPNAPVDTNSTINLDVMFVGYTEGGWNNTTSLFDLISYYKGTDYAGIIEELDQHGAGGETEPTPTPVPTSTPTPEPTPDPDDSVVETKLEVDFEDGALFFEEWDTSAEGWGSSVGTLVRRSRHQHP